MLNIITRESLRKSRPKRNMGDFSTLRENIALHEQGARTIAEFTGTGDYASAFFARQRYEVEAGREEEPLLYTSIYDVVEDESLPETLTIYTLNPKGVVMEEVKEGEEVKFTTVAEGSKSIRQVQYAVGLEYSKRLFKFMGNLWQIPRLERSFAQGINAKLNDIHLSPFIDHSYTSAYKVDGTSLSPARFRATESIEIKTMRTIEQAIGTARGNNAYGRYGILCSTSDVYMIDRALNPVQQRGSDRQGDLFSQIQTVIAYDGWSGTRGKRAVSYSGVSDGTAYLISLNRIEQDFLSLVSQSLDRQQGNGDPRRFILEEDIWDMWLGVYTNVAETTIEITLPNAASGTS